MPREISSDIIAAEALGFVLGAPVSFDQALTRLGQQAPGQLDRETEGLGAAFGEHIRLRAGGWSLAVLDQMRDSVWFPEEARGWQGTERGGRRLPLGELLLHHARRFLERGGGRVRLRQERDLPQKAGQWRWLTCFLPADLLVAVLAAGDGFEPPMEEIEIVSPQVRALLARGVAETHLHVGAGFNFGTVWTGLVQGVSQGQPGPRELGRGTPFGPGAAFHARLLQAALARMVLASFRWHAEVYGRRGPFEAFVNEQLPAIAARLPFAGGSQEALRLTGAHLRGLFEARPPTAAEVPALVALVRAWMGAPAVRRPRCLDDVMGNDPLAAWLRPVAGQALAETGFAARGLAYLLREGRDDAQFARIFWQYQRIRTRTYQYIVEPPGTAGLDWFTQFYGRISPLRRTLGAFRFEAAARTEKIDVALGALEVRTSPESSWQENVALIRQLEQQSRRAMAGSREPTEFGLCLHFTKERMTLDGKGLNADPSRAPYLRRHGSWFAERFRQALALARAIDVHPELLVYLRAIDIANVELAMPLWPFVPLFAHVRAASERASARLASERPDLEVRPLRTTIHAGEDFRRLHEGLRRIDETMEFGMLRTGDRIGHGVALGVDPVLWCRQAARIEQPSEERLDDLLWELELYAHGHCDFDGARLELVRTEARQLGRRIHGRDDVTLDDLRESRRLRHDPELLAVWGYPRRERRPQSRPEELLEAYLTSFPVFQRGQTPVSVCANEGEARALARLQRCVRKRVAASEITIESNPSSNLLIGDFLSLEEHPAFRLHPLDPSHTELGPSVLLSINNDNPISFASKLADEYAYVYYALLRRGLPSREALAWLEEARECGMNSRFTLPSSVPGRA